MQIPEESSLTMCSPSLEDHFLNPASLESVIDHICGEVKTIANTLISLHSHRDVSFIQVDMYRAEFLDLIRLLLWPIVERTDLFFTVLGKSIDRKGEASMIRFREHVQAKALPRLQSMTDACETFLSFLHLVADSWKSRSLGVIGELKNRQSKQPIVTRLSQTASQYLWSPTPGSVQAIPALLQHLDATLARLAGDVERVDVYWRQRSDRLTRNFGTLSLTWNEVEYFCPAWRHVGAHWQDTGNRIAVDVGQVSFLKPIMSPRKLNASWLTPGASRDA